MSMRIRSAIWTQVGANLDRGDKEDTDEAVCKSSGEKGQKVGELVYKLGEKNRKSGDSGKRS